MHMDELPMYLGKLPSMGELQFAHTVAKLMLINENFMVFEKYLVYFYRNGSTDAKRK